MNTTEKTESTDAPETPQPGTVIKNPDGANGFLLWNNDDVLCFMVAVKDGSGVNLAIQLRHHTASGVEMSKLAMPVPWDVARALGAWLDEGERAVAKAPVADEKRPEGSE